MPFRKSRRNTPAKLAANRENAQKSTGPRTLEGKRRASLNSYQHGCYAALNTRRRQALEELRDDPAEYDRLHHQLFAAWKPANAMQALVVLDLVELYWKKMQLDNTTLAARLREKKRLEGDAEDLKVNAERVPGNLHKIAGETGLRGAVNYRTFLDRTCNLLDEIVECLADCERLDKIREDLGQIYMERPSQRGRKIIELFMRLEADKDANDPSLVADLKRLVAQERACVIQEHEFAQGREQEAIRENRPAVWEPGAAHWNLIVGVEADLNQEIALKVKLLIQLKSLPQAADQPETGGEEEPEPAAAGKSSK
jgi:hypothetical protein